MTVKAQQRNIRFLPYNPGLIITAAFGFICVMFIYSWLAVDVRTDFTERLPSKQDSIETTVSQAQAGPQFGKLEKFDGKPADLPGIWPGFRGAGLDAISNQNITLASSWGQGGPKVLWSLNLGEGYAGAAVRNSRVYIMDYDQANFADAIRCLSLADGKEIWRYSYPVKIKRDHGMSRTVPVVTDKYIVTIGPKCHVTCLDPNSGQMLWWKDLAAEYGTTIPQWYAGQCPLIENGRLIIAPAGPDALIMAVDCATGKTIWQSPNPNKWEMTHSSITPAEFQGQRMYIYCASEGVTGVSAEDGRILWEYSDWKIPLANVAAPLVIGDGRIFFAGGYNAGSMVLQLVQQDGKIVAQPVFWPQFNIALQFQKDLDSGAVSEQMRKEFQTNNFVLSTAGVTVKIEESDNRWLIVDGIKQYSVTKSQQGLVVSTTRLKPEVFGSSQQTPILYQGHIYGMRPDRRFVCLDLAGKTIWESPETSRFGKTANDGLGPYSIADGKIYILDDEGTLTLVQANTTGYVQLAQAKVLNGPQAWAPMAFAAGRLLVRDLNRMVCLDIEQ